MCVSDVQENVISNTMKGSNLLNLSGMYSCSTVNNVLIYRPLLSINKNLQRWNPINPDDPVIKIFI